jgi:hypothetical protein
MLLRKVVSEGIIKESEDPEKKKKRLLRNENQTLTARNSIQCSLKKQQV